MLEFYLAVAWVFAAVSGAAYGWNYRKPPSDALVKNLIVDALLWPFYVAFLLGGCFTMWHGMKYPRDEVPPR